jgi:hypothetical protein
MSLATAGGIRPAGNQGDPRILPPYLFGLSVNS